MRVSTGAGLVLLLTLSATEGHARTAAEQALGNAMATFAQAQQNVGALTSKSDRLFADLNAERKRLCDAADAANTTLLGYQGQEPAAATKLAMLAVDAQASCDIAERRRDRFRQLQGDLHKASLSVLRLIASDLDKCQADESAPCRAEALKGVVSSLATSLLDNPSADALLASNKQLVEAAAKAQQSVVGARAKAADVYALGDAAAASALGSPVADDATVRGRELREAAKAGVWSPGAARTAVGDAQEAANVLVSNAIELVECRAKDVDCTRNKQRERLAAALAQVQLHDGLARAEEQYGTTKEATWSAAASPHAKMADRRKSVAFARLLDTYPDARSLVGESSAGQINAAGGDASATIKYSIGRTQLLGSQQHSITLSTPIGSNGLARTPQSLAYSTYWLRGIDSGSKIPVVDRLWVAGLSPKVSYTESTYYDKARFGETLSSRQRAWSLSGFLGLYRPASVNPDVHLLELEVKREPKEAEAEFRCATPAAATDASVKCLQGAFGPPEKGYARLYKYQWRTEFAKFSLSPTLSYNDGNKETKFELPIYFIRPEGKNQPFNAGIRFDWGSKSRDRIGIFVGTNFELYGVPER